VKAVLDDGGDALLDEFSAVTVAAIKRVPWRHP
jgi:hypothetical protein